VTRKKKKEKTNTGRRFHVERGEFGHELLLERVSFVSEDGGGTPIHIGPLDGPVPDEPTDVRAVGRVPPTYLDAWSNSSGSMMSGGEYDALSGKLVHRPGKGFAGWSRRGRSKTCGRCGSERFVFSKTCGRCGAKL
jgi:hypothetical protein